jgi:hypothetical protein
MAWNQVARPLSESLPRDYESKGLAHWEREYEKACQRVRAADNAGSLGRAVRRKQLCEIAVIGIKQAIEKGWLR